MSTILPGFSFETAREDPTRVAYGTVFSTRQGESSHFGHKLLEEYIVSDKRFPNVTHDVTVASACDTGSLGSM